MMKRLSILLNKFEKVELDNKKIAAIVIVCLALIYVDFAFLMKMQLAALKNIGPKITKLKTDLTALNKDLNSMEYSESQQVENRQKLLAHTKKIIPQEQITSLMQEISEIANKDRVDIIQMKPSMELPGKEDKSGAQKQKFTPLLLMLDLTCDYHHLGSFINDLENAQVFISVTDLKITSEETNYLKQNVNLVLKTYVR
ncbi:MAG TPA: type 4a pilus biogenesis protein PilO [Candidatus Margulisiibacteriota bacterium]|nr:type 4a pilus biogenesis protein PilO [Candidatus Margulisiibacteriota bacterium]